MVEITKLFCSPKGEPARPYPALWEGLQSGWPTTPEPLPSRNQSKPVVVWNVTRTCNLNCLHCYSESRPRKFSGELTSKEAEAMIEDLAQFGIPVLHFSGGEPLTRPDLLEQVAYARARGISPALSTNGTLLTSSAAARLKRAGLSYVGISLDGFGAVNDCARAKDGAFDAALAGFRNCAEADLPVGLRIILTKRNYPDLNALFDLIEREGIQRACFHHLIYAGRGNNMQADDLTHQQTRGAMDLILRRSQDFCRRGLNIEILTADNYADGVYLYLKLAKTDAALAAQVYALLERMGGGARSSGVGVGNIDAQGNVHPDPYWAHYSLGSIRQKPFSRIWTDPAEPLMAKLKDRLPLLKGRCAKCRWKEICGGSNRVRAERVYGDPWMHDPACYLSHEEISQEAPQPVEAMEEDVQPEREAA